jgi:hypothetical protein
LRLVVVVICGLDFTLRRESSVLVKLPSRVFFLAFLVVLVFPVVLAFFVFAVGAGFWALAAFFAAM